jgi:uncharacterized protein (TIGR02231 family)
MRRVPYYCVPPILLSILLATESGSAAAAESPPGSRVVAVTVYPDAALVTREVRLSLPTGEQRVILTGIPSVADPDSARVTGSGSGDLEIGGIEVRREFSPPETSEGYRRLKDDLDALTRQATGLADRQKAIGELREFLTGLKAITGEESSRDLLTRGFAVASWRQAFDFLSERYDALAGENRDLETRRRGLEERLEVARRRLEQVASRAGIERFAAAVTVRAARPGDAVFHLTYLARGASWTPIYDARLDPATGKVFLATRALVTQSTGEDWNDVAVTLATNRPSAGLEIPRLASLFLWQEPETLVSGGFINILPIMGRNAQDGLNIAPGAVDADGNRSQREMAEAKPAAARPDRSEVAVTYSLPGTLTFPSDGQPHKHLVGEREMAAAIEHRSVPRLVPGVYLAARITLAGDTPLLPGRVQHFVGPDLVGTSQMVGRSVGEEIVLSFGPDDRMKAERQRVRGHVDHKGKDDVTDLRFLTTIANHLGRDAVVELKDRVPVAADERISVTIDEDDTTPGFAEDPGEPGILTWKVAVPKDDERQVILRYRVRAPRGLPVDTATDQLR